jgi:hypothetical protein
MPNRSAATRLSKPQADKLMTSFENLREPSDLIDALSELTTDGEATGDEREYATEETQSILTDYLSGVQKMVEVAKSVGLTG